MLRKIKTIAITIAMIFMVLPTAITAEGSTSVATTSASVKYSEDGNTVTITMDSYLTDQTALNELAITGSDIVFLLDQSANMSEGRDGVISNIQNLISSLPTPTTGGDHRIAIAGYGRIRNSGTSDPSGTYTGNKSFGSGTMSNANTGYYTYSNSSVGFTSAGTWKEGTTTTAPTHTETIDYSTAFLSVADAESVCTSAKMAPWYTKAARMDAGLALANNLVDIAKSSRGTNTTRKTIVILVSSSVPFQSEVSGGSTVYTSRAGACTESATAIKNSDATIYALGDYHQNTSISDDTIDSSSIFDTSMSSVSSNTDSDTSYYVSATKYSSVSDAMQQLMTLIQNHILNISGSSETVSVSKAATVSSDNIDISEITKRYNLNLTEAQVSFYKFASYSDSSPAFDETAYSSTDSGTVVNTDGVLSYTANLTPIPTYDVYNNDGKDTKYIYGEKVQIVVTGTAAAYNVTLNGSYESNNHLSAENLGENKATYNTAYSSALTADTGYTLPTSINIYVDGSKEPLDASSYTYNSSTGAIAIKKEAVIGNINIVASYSTVTYPDADKDDNNDNVPDTTGDTVQSGKQITVDPNGGSWKSSTEIQTFEITSDITLEDPSYDGYLFMGWKKTAGTDPVASIFTAQWEKDANKDNIPDKYQKTVTFKVVNGTWSDDSATDIVNTLTLVDDNGKWSADGSATLSIPDSMKAASGYKNGSWDTTPIASVSKDSQDSVTYTYSFVKKASDSSNSNYAVPYTGIKNSNSGNITLLILWALAAGLLAVRRRKRFN